MSIDMWHFKVVVALMATARLVTAADVNTKNDKCGGEIVTPDGTINSPNYPRPSLPNINCTWQFKGLDTSQWMYITFTSIQLQPKDILNVTELSESGNFTHSFSGVRDTFTLVVKPNARIFFSAISPNAKFEASYTNKSCGNELVLTHDHGILESPLYAQRSKPDSFECVWTISSSDTDHLKFLISFIKFNLSKNWLAMYSGLKVDPTKLLQNATGLDVPDDLFASVVITFQLHIEVEDNLAVFTTEFESVSDECSKKMDIKNPLNIEIQTSGWDPVVCVQIIKSDVNTTVLVDLVDVSLLNMADVLILNDGRRKYSSNLKALNFADKIAKNYLITTRENGLFVYFSTFPVKSVSSFNIVVSVQAVGGNLYNNGNFSLPPQTTGQDVVFSLNVDDTEQVEASLRTANLQPENLILFYEIDGNDRRLLANFSKETQLRPVFSMTNKLLIVAKNFNGSGAFDGTFHGIPRGCDTYDRTAIGSYQLKRNDTGNCTWLIKPTEVVDGNILALTLSSVRLGQDDIIAVYKGFSGNADTLIEVFNKSMTVKPVLYIDAKDGVRIDSKVVSVPTTEDYVQLKAYYELNQGCNREIIVVPGTEYVISSLGYPGHYPLNINCSWHIKAPANRTLFLRFADVDIFEKHELSVYALKNGTKNLLMSTNGQPYPDDLILNNNDTLVVWNSSFGIEGRPVRGFSIEARILECGGNLTTGSGEFETPELHNKSLYCVWGIAIPNPDMKKPNIVQFKLTGCTSTKDLNTDILEIHDGGSLTSGIVPPPELNSSSLSRTNKLLVKYTPSTEHNKTFKFSFSTKSCDQVCKNGICMHSDWRCNGENNCGDFSDEENCDSLTKKPGVSIPWFFVGMIMALIVGIVGTVFIPVGVRRFREWRLRYQDFRTLPDE